MIWSSAALVILLLLFSPAGRRILPGGFSILPHNLSGGSPDEYRVGLDHALAKSWLWLHESGTYPKFTPAGAELFA
jgi:hypothetical protein